MSLNTLTLLMPSPLFDSTTGLLCALAFAGQAVAQEFPGVPELDPKAMYVPRTQSTHSPVALDTNPGTCLVSAATFHGVNASVLAAIGQHESGFRPMTVARNSNGTLDRGIFGANSVHLSDLSRYGVQPADLHDSCKSAYVAAWQLKGHINRLGNNWRAVGAYHSRTPGVLEPYANTIHAILRGWGVLNTPEPFPGFGTKARPGPLARGARATVVSTQDHRLGVASMIAINEMPPSSFEKDFR